MSEAVLVTQPDQDTRKWCSVLDSQAFCILQDHIQIRKVGNGRCRDRGKGESSCFPDVRIFPGEQGAELEHRSEKPPCVTVHLRLPKVGRACNGQG